MGNRGWPGTRGAPTQARVQARAPTTAWDFKETQGCRSWWSSPTAAKGASSASPAPTWPEPPDWWLLYTHPTDPRQRSNLGVYLNRWSPGPATWPEPTPAGPGSCAYQTCRAWAPALTALFGCLYESDDYMEIVFVMFTLQQAFLAEFLLQ